MSTSRFTFLSVVFLLLSVDHTMARLGENTAELDTRYGHVGAIRQPGRMEGLMATSVRVYKKGNYWIEACMNDDGRCVMISYLRDDAMVLSDPEVAILLLAEGGKRHWIPVEKTGDWTTTDQYPLAAMFDSAASRKRLVFCRRNQFQSALKTTQDKIDSRQRKALEGF